ncbi:hypothetical protein ACTFIV_000542 [Dictyostelium citrinum]
MIKKDVYGFYKGDGTCVFISDKKSWGYIKRSSDVGGYRTFEIDFNLATHKMEIYNHANGRVYSVGWSLRYFEYIEIRMESSTGNFYMKVPYFGDVKTLTDRADNTYSVQREINMKANKDKKKH